MSVGIVESPMNSSWLDSSLLSDASIDSCKNDWLPAEGKTILFGGVLENDKEVVGVCDFCRKDFAKEEAIIDTGDKSKNSYLHTRCYDLLGRDIEDRCETFFIKVFCGLQANNFLRFVDVRDRLVRMLDRKTEIPITEFCEQKGKQKLLDIMDQVTKQFERTLNKK